VYIAAVFEDEKFGKFKYDSSFERFNGNGFSEGLFIIEIFLAFSSGDMKDLSVSLTFCRIIALTSLIIWFIIASDKINNWFWGEIKRLD
jgi:hypothetical protein